MLSGNPVNPSLNVVTSLKDLLTSPGQFSYFPGTGSQKGALENKPRHFGGLSHSSSAQKPEIQPSSHFFSSADTRFLSQEAFILPYHWLSFTQ